MACCRYPESLPFPLQLSAPKVVLELELRTSDRWASGCEALQVRPDGLLDSEQLELNSSKEILTSLLGSEIKERGALAGESARVCGGCQDMPRPPALRRSPGA